MGIPSTLSGFFCTFERKVYIYIINMVSNLRNASKTLELNVRVSVCVNNELPSKRRYSQVTLELIMRCHNCKVSAWDSDGVGGEGMVMLISRHHGDQVSLIDLDRTHLSVKEQGVNQIDLKQTKTTFSLPSCSYLFPNVEM